MKVAITSEGPDLCSRVDPHFGRANGFILLDTETDEFSAHDNAQNVNASQGAGIQAGRTIADLGAEAILTGSVGPKALTALRAANVTIYTGVAGTIGEAFEKFKTGKLQPTDVANAEGDRI
jgi:predicted Fe-Mo cluster-binding NifX family protein